MFFLASIVTEYLRFFFYRAIPINLFQSITNSQTAEKVMSHHISPNGSAGRGLPAYAVLRRHKSFNLHYFRPYFLWQISFLQFRPNLRFRFLSSNSPSFSLQRRKSPQTRPQGQFNNQQSHFNKCCNSRKEKDTILTCTASSFCLTFLLLFLHLSLILA